MPSRSTTPSKSRVALASRREEAAVAQVLADGQVREQPRILEHIADAAPVLRHEDRALPYRPARGRRRRSCPASGRISPPIRLTSEVLPEPDGPNSAVSRPLVSKAASSSKSPSRWRMSTGERHSTSIRLPTRRASTSEATSAAMAMAIEISVSRSAPASPPGTWVKV